MAEQDIAFGEPREEIVSGQPSLAEFIVASGQTDPDLQQEMYEAWLGSLTSNTTLGEVFYLAGVEDQTDREECLHELFDRAEASDINVGYGNTLRDLRGGRAPQLYRQLFNPNRPQHLQ